MKNEFRLDSNDFGLIRDGVSNVDGYNRNADIIRVVYENVLSF